MKPQTVRTVVTGAGAATSPRTDPRTQLDRPARGTHRNRRRHRRHRPALPASSGSARLRHRCRALDAAAQAGEVPDPQHAVGHGGGTRGGRGRRRPAACRGCAAGRLRRQRRHQSRRRDIPAGPRRRLDGGPAGRLGNAGRSGVAPRRSLLSTANACQWRRRHHRHRARHPGTIGELRSGRGRGSRRDTDGRRRSPRGACGRGAGRRLRRPAVGVDPAGV